MSATIRWKPTVEGIILDVVSSYFEGLRKLFPGDENRCIIRRSDRPYLMGLMAGLEDE